MVSLSSADSKDLTKIFEDLSKILRNPSNAVVNFGTFFGTKHGKVFSILGDQFSANLGDVRKDVLGFLG